jgi:hypothetical protein
MKNPTHIQFHYVLVKENILLVSLCTGKRKHTLSFIMYWYKENTLYLKEVDSKIRNT